MCVHVSIPNIFFKGSGARQTPPDFESPRAHGQPRHTPSSCQPSSLRASLWQSWTSCHQSCKRAVSHGGENSRLSPYVHVFTNLVHELKQGQAASRKDAAGRQASRWWRPCRHSVQQSSDIVPTSEQPILLTMQTSMLHRNLCSIFFFVSHFHWCQIWRFSTVLMRFDVALSVTGPICWDTSARRRSSLVESCCQNNCIYTVSTHDTHADMLNLFCQIGAPCDSEHTISVPERPCFQWMHAQ